MRLRDLRPTDVAAGLFLVAIMIAVFFSAETAHLVVNAIAGAK